MVHFYPHEVHLGLISNVRRRLRLHICHDNCYCIVFMESKSQLHRMGATPIQCVNIATLVTIRLVKKVDMDAVADTDAQRKQPLIRAMRHFDLTGDLL